MLQFFATILDIFGSAVLQVIDTGIRFCIVLSLVESSFLPFHIFTLYLFIYQFLGVPPFFESFVMMSQLLLNSEVAEHIAFMCDAWADSIASCKYVYWSIGIQTIVV